MIKNDQLGNDRVTVIKSFLLQIMALTQGQNTKKQLLEGTMEQTKAGRSWKDIKSQTKEIKLCLTFLKLQLGGKSQSLLYEVAKTWTDTHHFIDLKNHRIEFQVHSTWKLKWEIS